MRYTTDMQFSEAEYTEGISMIHGFYTTPKTKPIYQQQNSTVGVPVFQLKASVQHLFVKLTT